MSIETRRSGCITTARSEVELRGRPRRASPRGPPCGARGWSATGRGSARRRALLGARWRRAGAQGELLAVAGLGRGELARATERPRRPRLSAAGVGRRARSRRRAPPTTSARFGAQSHELSRTAAAPRRARPPRDGARDRERLVRVVDAARLERGARRFDARLPARDVSPAPRAAAIAAPRELLARVARERRRRTRRRRDASSLTRCAARASGAATNAAASVAQRLRAQRVRPQRLVHHRREEHRLGVVGAAPPRAATPSPSRASALRGARRSAAAPRTRSSARRASVGPLAREVQPPAAVRPARARSSRPWPAVSASSVELVARRASRSPGARGLRRSSAPPSVRSDGPVQLRVDWRTRRDRDSVRRARSRAASRPSARSSVARLPRLARAALVRRGWTSEIGARRVASPLPFSSVTTRRTRPSSVERPRAHLRRHEVRSRRRVDARREAIEPRRSVRVLASPSSSPSNMSRACPLAASRTTTALRVRERQLRGDPRAALLAWVHEQIERHPRRPRERARHLAPRHVERPPRVPRAHVRERRAARLGPSFASSPPPVSRKGPSDREVGHDPQLSVRFDPRAGPLVGRQGP